MRERKEEEGKRGEKRTRQKGRRTRRETGSRAEGKSLFLKGEQRRKDNLEERSEGDVGKKGRQEKVVKRRVDRRKVNQKKKL